MVIDTPVYFGTMASMMWTFIERSFGYRHVDIPIAGRPFVLMVGGALRLDPTIEELHRVLSRFEVNVLDTVRFLSEVPPCFKCGRHRECEIGGTTNGLMTNLCVCSEEYLTRTVPSLRPRCRSIHFWIVSRPRYASVRAASKSHPLGWRR